LFNYRWKVRLDRQEIVAYLAGVFDGEGAVMIFKSSPRGRYKSPIYRLVVSVTNTNRELLEFAQKHLGGNVRGPYVRGAKWSPSYRWEMDDDEAIEFLKNIELYTQAKLEHIKVAIEFREQISQSRTGSLGRGHGSKPMSNVEVEAREACYQRMKRLNQRGLRQDE